jgi:hypothetical protein
MALAALSLALVPQGNPAAQEAGAQGAAAAEGPGGEAAAKPAPDDSALLLIPAAISMGDPASADDAAAFGSALDSALEQALLEKGFAVKRSPEPLPQGGDPRDAAPLALDSGSGWAAMASVDLSDKRLACSVNIYDARDSALAASAGFSSYAGLSALPMMAEAAKSAAEKAAAYRSSTVREAGNQVPYRITLNSPDEGAIVSIGAAGSLGSRELGSIAGGSLVLPYLSLEKGSTIVLSLSAKNRISLDLPVKLGDEAPTVEAPAMKSLATEEFLVGTGPGHLLGAESTYRIFINPDWSFFYTNQRLFAGYDFTKGSVPVLHFESWTGLGWYLVFPPESAFRLGACVGGGVMLSASSAKLDSLFVDVAIIPIQVFMEYRLPRGPTLWYSMRGAYSLGAGGLLGQGWIGGSGPDLSAGVLWRR